MKRKRKGTIYFEVTNKGRSSRRIGPRGVGGIVYTSRWVGEITVNGRRYRKRSTNFDNVKFWLEKMVALYPNYEAGPRLARDKEQTLELDYHLSNERETMD